jgi:hypothetical protein
MHYRHNVNLLDCFVLSFTENLRKTCYVCNRFGQTGDAQINQTITQAKAGDARLPLVLQQQQQSNKVINMIVSHRYIGVGIFERS